MPGEIHPFVLHFAVGLLLVAPLSDALGLLLHREGLLITGRWTTLMGTIAAVATVLSGLGAEATLPPHSAAGEALLNIHGALGWVTLLVWVPVAAWRAAVKGPLPIRARTLYLALAMAGGVILTAETLLGSAMVYRHGLGLSPAARAEPLAQTPASGRVKVEKGR